MPFSAPVLTYRAKGLASNIQSKVLKVHNTLININITAISAPEMTYTPKFNGFDVSVCHNKNDALILVFPKISASLSDKKRHLNGLYCVSCYSVPKTGRQRIYNHFCSFSELKKSFHLRLFLKSGARLGIMPKELKGLPYRISFKVLQIYGKIFIRAPFA